MFFLGFFIAVTVPVLMVFRGIHLQKNPPVFNSGNLSFRTKFIGQNEDIWNYSNGLFCHMMKITGINTGLISIVFYFSAIYLTDTSQWMVVSLSLLVFQAICVMIVWGITIYIAQKTYRAQSDEDAALNQDTQR